MRLFVAAYSFDMKELLDAMEKTSFIKKSIEKFNFEDRFFCAITRSKEDNEIFWSNIPPLVIVTLEPKGTKADLYKWHKISFDDLAFFVGVLSDREFIFTKEWKDLYGTQKEDFYKALSDTIYKYLLSEVIDETAEWCGHMSSVVHKM